MSTILTEDALQSAARTALVDARRDARQMRLF